MVEQPLTIYFDLSSDARPTIGAVGKAMVEFEKMAGETVFLMEPGVKFSMVYQYSAPGSLRIVAGLRGLVTRERLKYLAIIIATTLVNNAAGHIQGKAMDEVIKAIAGEESVLTEKDIQTLVEALQNVERSHTVTVPRREFYKAVEPDPAITGIGAVPTENGEPPTVIVPRSEFGERSGAIIEKEREDQPEPRVLSERVEVVLANAPLIESRAKWRILLNGHQIPVKMLDENFHQQLLDGATHLKLASGVILDVTLEKTLVYADGVWQNKSYAISEVHSWRQSPEQAELLLSHSGDDNNQNDQSAQ